MKTQDKLLIPVACIAVIFLIVGFVLTSQLQQQLNSSLENEINPADVKSKTNGIVAVMWLLIVIMAFVCYKIEKNTMMQKVTMYFPLFVIVILAIAVSAKFNSTITKDSVNLSYAVFAMSLILSLVYFGKYFYERSQLNQKQTNKDNDQTLPIRKLNESNVVKTVKLNESTITDDESKTTNEESITIDDKSTTNEESITIDDKFYAIRDIERKKIYDNSLIIIPNLVHALRSLNNGFSITHTYWKKQNDININDKKNLKNLIKHIENYTTSWKEVENIAKIMNNFTEKTSVTPENQHKIAMSLINLYNNNIIYSSVLKESIDQFQNVENSEISFNVQMKILFHQPSDYQYQLNLNFGISNFNDIIRDMYAYVVSLMKVCETSFQNLEVTRAISKFNESIASKRFNDYLTMESDFLNFIFNSKLNFIHQSVETYQSLQTYNYFMSDEFVDIIRWNGKTNSEEMDADVQEMFETKDLHTTKNKREEIWLSFWNKWKVIQMNLVYVSKTVSFWPVHYLQQTNS